MGDDATQRRGRDEDAEKRKSDTRCVPSLSLQWLWNSELARLDKGDWEASFNLGRAFRAFRWLNPQSPCLSLDHVASRLESANPRTRSFALRALGEAGCCAYRFSCDIVG